MLFQFVLGGQNFQAQPIGFPMPAQFIGVGGAEHDVHHVGKLRQNCGQGIEHVFDAFIR